MLVSASFILNDVKYKKNKFPPWFSDWVDVLSAVPLHSPVFKADVRYWQSDQGAIYDVVLSSKPKSLGESQINLFSIGNLSTKFKKLKRKQRIKWIKKFIGKRLRYFYIRIQEENHRYLERSKETLKIAEEYAKFGDKFLSSLEKGKDPFFAAVAKRLKK